MSEAQDPVPPVFVACVGASAGGLEALVEFFKVAQVGSGIAYVVVQHLSPDFKSMMVELVGRHTDLRVKEVVDGERPLPDTVYLLPPKQVLVLAEGVFRLSERDPVRLSLPINIFLASLAAEQRELSAAVILSGTGTDGTHGSRLMKEAGGLVLAQDPSSAKFDGMPTSVITSNLADRVGPPAVLCKQLMQYAAHPTLQLADDETAVREEEAITTVVRILSQHSRVDFTQYKRGTISRRLQRRTSLLGYSAIREYVEVAESDADELDVLAREMLIGVTQFFRDPDVWAFVETTLIPQILSSTPEHGVIRIWCVGCSTGEEAYTLAMLFQEVLRNSQRQVTFKLFASDARADSLVFARNALYPQAACDLVPPLLRERYFEPQGDQYLVRRSLRDSVTFAVHDLLVDPPFTQLDLVCCRNVLIYLSHEAQQRTLTRFRLSLKEGGLLVLGSSESVGDTSLSFTPVGKRQNTYVARGTPAKSALMSTPMRVGRVEEGLGSRAHPRAAELLYQAVIERHAPPGVAISPELEVLQTFGDVSEFVRIPVGRVSMNLLKLASQTAALVLNAAIRKAMASGEEIRQPDVRASLTREDASFTISVYPMSGPTGLAGHLLIFFEEQKVSEGHLALAGVDIEAAVKQRIEQLEYDLTTARESLHSAVQDLESTNEELQSTNEELTVSNEELQSTNEELQSVNEELYTVNTEYQQKIAELEELNTDLENLLKVMAAGVVFLDETLAIRRFNDSAKQLLPMRREDLGRPLSELAFRGNYPQLLPDAQRVLETGERITRQIAGQDDSRWSVGLRLFQASASEPRGVIMTMHEVSELTKKSSELAQLQRAHEMAEEIAGTGHAIADLTNSRVLFSSGAQRLFDMAHASLPLDRALELFGPEVRDQVQAGLTKIKGGMPVPFVVDRSVRKANGDELKVRMSVQTRTEPVTEARLLFAVFQPR